MSAAAKEVVARDVIKEIHGLIDEIANEYSNTLLSIRADLIRARARIKERQHDDTT